MRLFLTILAFFLLASPLVAETVLPPIPQGLPPQGIIVRTTENVTKGGWVWLLNLGRELGLRRVDLLLKQDEDAFASLRTGHTLQSGELLVPLPGEETASGWEDPQWLEEMLDKAHEQGIKVWAWWPVFRDARSAARFPGHAYQGKEGERFNDPADPAVREYQERLLSSLLSEYELDGVSLDWIRYDDWLSGSNGPLAARFERQWGERPTAKVLEDESQKARWFQMRADLIASWVADLVRTGRTRHPGVSWGAFLLPWQFAEVSQDYRALSRVGLDHVQPMAYWDDWQFPPKWVGETALARRRFLADNTTYWPALDLENSEESILQALNSLPGDDLSGISWYVHGSWEQEHFQRLGRVLEQWAKVRVTPRQEQAVLPVASHPPHVMPLQPKSFSPDAGIWNLVCLAELYRRGALDDNTLFPVTPVLAFHGFEQGETGRGSSLWSNTSQFLDALFAFIAKAGFQVIPLSQFQAYQTAGDASMLPPRPLVLTIDDGSRSILDHFFPRAQKLRWPFTVSLVTGWIGDQEEQRHVIRDYKRDDPFLLWSEVEKLEESGLVEWVSHTHGGHSYVSETGEEKEGRPAVVARKFLKEAGRRESPAEHRRWLLEDLTNSRFLLEQHLSNDTTILTWPYGVSDSTSQAIAHAAGFTHFLLFDEGRFAVYTGEETIPRIGVNQADEWVSLQFPEGEEGQRWWLSFLKTARATHLPQVMKAVLAQLEPRAGEHPEAEITRAALDLLKATPGEAEERIKRLRASYPFSPEVQEAIDGLLN